jgi:tetratricopeptide (TPR) repeat protein
MSWQSPVRSIAALAAVLATVVLVLPSAANAWSLNLANAEIARASALPPDSPDRATALILAEEQLSSSRSSKSPRVSLARARILLYRGNSQAAAAVLATTNPWPPDPIIAYLRGEAEWKSGRLQDAFEDWRTAGAIEYFMQAAHRALDAHAWKEAEAKARIAGGIDPSSADAHHVLGEALSRQEADDLEALAELERAAQLTRDPEALAAIRSRQGEISADRGDRAQAISFFNQARAIAPSDPRPRTGYALALLKFELDSQKDAKSLLIQVTSDSPWYTAAFIALAGIAESQGDKTEAERWLTEGLARNRDNPQLLFALGGLYAREQRAAEARASLILALKHETRPDLLLAISHALDALRSP